MNQSRRAIQSKITRAILLTSTVVLLLTSLAYLTYEFFAFRQSTIDRIAVLGEVISNNSTAALAFDSEEDAYDILSALKAEEHVVAAALYDVDGYLFSKYPEELDNGSFPKELKNDGYFFEDFYLIGFQPVTLGSNRIGTLYLKYDLKVLSRQLMFYVCIALLIFILSLLLAWFLSYKLQQRISKPIITLASVARNISIHKDYAIRAVKQSEDEIGLLTDAFNQMLKQIEQQNIALRESEEFSRTLLDSSPDCLIALDLEGKILSINAQGLKILEIENFNKYNGKSWLDLWREEYHEKTSAAIEQGRNGKIGHFEAYSPTTKGTLKWWDVLLAPVYGADRDVERLISVSRDITQLKELEQQKNDFIGIASHELKTPVTSIKAYTQLLQLHFEEAKDEKASVMLAKMDVLIDKLTDLISDLLDVTKIEQGKLQFKDEVFDFNDLVKEVVEELQRTTKRHQIFVKLHKNTSARGDRDRLGQVITNFLTNAIKYSPKSDKIIVATEVKEDKEIILSVQDYGLGLSSEDQYRVFERFYRVTGYGHETYPGLGLGLYISSEIIYRHKGNIWVESKLGEGSTFYFSLPLR